jgi:hypothetical protein
MDEEDGVTGEVSDATWRNRFFLMFSAQIGGTLLALFGLLLWQTSYIVAGGSILGFVLALIGLAMTFFLPRMLATRWKQRDR